MDRPPWIESALSGGRSALWRSRRAVGRGGAALEKGARGAVERVGSLPGKLSRSSESESDGAKPDGAEVETPKPKAPEPNAPEPAKTPEPEGEKAAKTAEEPAGWFGSLVPWIRERPLVAIAGAVLVLLFVLWIAWAIYVGSTNGGNAAVGVLISWPLFVLVIANLALLGVGLTRLFQYLQPAGGPSGATATTEVKARDEAGSDEETKDEPDEDDEDADGDGEEEEQAPEGEAASASHGGKEKDLA